MEQCCETADEAVADVDNRSNNSSDSSSSSDNSNTSDVSETSNSKMLQSKKMSRVKIFKASAFSYCSQTC